MSAISLSFLRESGRYDKKFAQALPTIGANLNAYVPPTGSECDDVAAINSLQAFINAVNA